MHLALYVHDFHSHIGHSRATKELLNGLTVEQKDSVLSIEVIAYTCGDLDIMFPEFKCQKVFTEIKLPNLKPFILKALYFHFASLVHSIKNARNKIKLGIGIACLNVDLVNVQFIHEQWKPFFFKHRRLSTTAYVYKKILFAYFSLCEKYVYSPKRNCKYVVIANFLTTFLTNKFNTPLKKIQLIPSSVNASEFDFSPLSSFEIQQKLSSKYPALKDIRDELPIILFVGALERKGFFKALELVSTIPNSQLIVVGQSETPHFKMPNSSTKIVHIPFSKEVRDFYQLADLFIFPTTYEPFGLVILEAYAMGLDLIIPRENVGASEIISNNEGVFFFDQDSKIPIPHLRKISLKEKKERRQFRLESLKAYNWKEGGSKFYDTLKSINV